MIIDMPLGNKAFLTQLKNVEFIIEPFTTRKNAEYINIDTFVCRGFGQRKTLQYT
jgi:hypothetical protein